MSSKRTFIQFATQWKDEMEEILEGELTDQKVIQVLTTFNFALKQKYVVDENGQRRRIRLATKGATGVNKHMMRKWLTKLKEGKL